MIFDKIPYPTKAAEGWEALGREVEEYHGPLDDISVLMVPETDNAHISDVILAAEGINQFMSGHSCDASCLLPMASLAVELGNKVVAERAKSAHDILQAQPNWTSQEIHNFINDSLLIWSEEEIAENTRAANQAHETFEQKFASWLRDSFPRVEIADIDAYLSHKWELVLEHHPEIWCAKQIGDLSVRIDGKVAFELLKQCGFQGALKVRWPKPAIAAKTPIFWLWIRAIGGRELVLVRFSDAISLIDLESWQELARTPCSPSPNNNSEWSVLKCKQFMVDLADLSLSEPKFLRPLPKKLVYLK
jgi:hypothetical protein